MQQTATCRLLAEETAELAAWARQVEESEAPFEAATKLVRHLGAHPVGDHTEFGFWVPELADQGVEEVILEIFTPHGAVTFSHEPQTLLFYHDEIHIQRQGEYVWAVVSGLPSGRRDCFGAFYQLKVQQGGAWRTIADPLAYSLPFGAFAPAELYDMERLDHQREDRDYFRRHATISEEGQVRRFEAPTNILQIHLPTASEGGTLQGLTQLYAELARKLEAHEPLSPTEQNYLAYDAVQLMPVEPTIEFEEGEGFWQLEGVNDEGIASVQVQKPNMTNWGYDVVVSGSSAINPTLLATGRPDELVDFASVLHNFPGKPVQLIFDVVYGHADNQGLKLLDPHFFSGPNMYGQNLSYRHPVVRAILLEMQRRKVNFGADGVRVDGAQDFKVWDPDTQELYHDNDYLLEMSAIRQQVADVEYYPWMIFEDGRPWPREDWETASSYRDVIEQQPHCFQWGPLTFAHNTPCLQGFWNSKWWRIEEIVRHGSHWINGCANHDTLRRGYQIDQDRPINHRLGDNLPEILRRSYDHPAASLLTYGLFPGVPMEFIHATMRAPWGFIRNTDARYGVKVVAEEAGFLEWRADEGRFYREASFWRLKEMGFTDLYELRRFMRRLEASVHETDYDLAKVVAMLKETDPPLPGPEASELMLKEFARRFMDDFHEYCNVMHYTSDLNPEQTQFNLALRDFRRQHPWLIHDLREDEHFDREVHEDGTTLFYGLRISPEGSEQVLFVANMEGEPVTLVPTELPIPNLIKNNWQLAVAAPGVHFESADAPVQLMDAEGLLLYRELL